MLDAELGNEILPVVASSTAHASPLSAPFSAQTAPPASGPAHEMLLAAGPVTGIEPATASSAASTALAAHLAVTVLLVLGLLLLHVQPVVVGREVERGVLQTLAHGFIVLEDNESEVGNPENIAIA